jgi:hypothetical protein
MSSFSLGGSKSSSDSSSQYSEDVWSGQASAFEDMYRQMGNLWGNTQGGFGGLNSSGQWAGNFNQNAAQSATGGYEDLLGGGSYGNSDEILSRLYGSMDSQNGGTNTSKMYNDIIGGEGNSYIDPMVDAMRMNSQENLDRNLGMGELDAMSSGQSGSSRHAMADSMLKRRALQDMNSNEAALRAGSYDKDLDWKMKIAGLADEGVGDQQDRLMAMMAGSDANVGAGINYGQNMQNLGMGAMAPGMQAMMAPWMMMNMYNQGMGDPTVLGQGSSKSSGDAISAGGSFGG